MVSRSLWNRGLSTEQSTTGSWTEHHSAKLDPWVCCVSRTGNGGSLVGDGLSREMWVRSRTAVMPLCGIGTLFQL